MDRWFLYLTRKKKGAVQSWTVTREADRWSWNSFENVSRQFFRKRKERGGRRDREGGESLSGRNFRKSVRKRTGWTLDESKLVDLRSGKITDRDEPSKWTGAFYGSPFSLDRLRDFSEAYIRTSRRKSSITKTSGFREQFPQPRCPPFLPCHVHKRQVTSKRNHFIVKRMVIHRWSHSVITSDWRGDF